MKNRTVKLIESIEQKVIGSRFLVKASIYNDGVHKKSIMVAVRDLVENGFTLKFFKDEDDVESFIKLLHTATKL